jgi:hypothetical protein
MPSLVTREATRQDRPRFISLAVPLGLVTTYSCSRSRLPVGAIEGGNVW